jgi:diguanylate cyclase (GGDEF)-like protein
VARYGGEEFIIILDGAGAECCARYLEHFRATVEKTQFEIPDGIISVTISAGVAHRRSQSLSELINDADMALYKAKNNGRNKVIVL